MDIWSVSGIMALIVAKINTKPTLKANIEKSSHASEMIITAMNRFLVYE